MVKSIWYRLPAVHCSLFTVYCLLFTVYCLLFTVYWLLTVYRLFTGCSRVVHGLLHYPLRQHCVCHLDKSTYIGTFHIIDITIGFCAILNTSGMNILHDHVKSLIYLFS